MRLWRAVAPAPRTNQPVDNDTSYSFSNKCPLVTMDISGPPLMTLHAYQSLLVGLHRYSKLIARIMTFRTPASLITSFSDGQIILHGFPVHRFMETALRSTIRFFNAFATFGTEHLTTTTCQQHTHGQPKPFNNTIMIRFWQYLSEHQQSRDKYVQP